jgi:hypothetical protein
LAQLIRGQNPVPAGDPAQGCPTGAIVYGDGCQEIHGGHGLHHRWGNGWQQTGPSAVEYESQRHTHHWDYIPPHGLRYPPPGQPNAVVFYPYYTLKGPDDFFYGMIER